MNSDQRFIVAISTPFFFASLAALYSYSEFSSNGIIPPSLWVATFLAAFFTFVIVYFISMTMELAEMIAIKRVCKFFYVCRFADGTSRTCTIDAGGNYCGVYRTLLKLQKEKKKDEEKR